MKSLDAVLIDCGIGKLVDTLYEMNVPVSGIARVKAVLAKAVTDELVAAGYSVVEDHPSKKYVPLR